MEKGLRFIEKVFPSRYQTIDDSRFIGFCRRKKVAFQNHLHRRIADEARQPLAPSCPGEKPHLTLGKPDQGCLRVRGDSRRAGQRKLKPAARADAVDRRNGRDLQRVEPVKGIVEDIEGHLDLAGLFHLLNHFQVGPGKEIIGLAGNENDAGEVAGFFQLLKNVPITGHSGLCPRIHRIARHVKRHDCRCRPLFLN